MELALNEVVAENQWQKKLVTEAKEASLVLETRLEQIDRRLQVVTRHWLDMLSPYEDTKKLFATTNAMSDLVAIDSMSGLSTEKLLKLIAKLLSRTQ